MPQAHAPLTRRGIPLERDLRVLALGSFANRFGAGAVMTTSALYFTRQVGFSAAEVALALAVAAVVGILVQVPAGQLGDSHGPRRVLTVFMVGAALTSALPALARTPWQLALLLALLTLFERSAGSVQQGGRDHEARRKRHCAGDAELAAMGMAVKQREDGDDHAREGHVEAGGDRNQQAEGDDGGEDHRLDEGQGEACDRKAEAGRHHRHEGGRNGPERPAADLRRPHGLRRFPPW